MFIQGTIGMFIFWLAFVVVFVTAVKRIKRGLPVGIRRVAGIDAIDEAIGRCTEMGRPVFYTFGLGELDSQVLASFDVLGYVSRQCALLETDLIVGNTRPEVHPITEEIVKGSYTAVGKTDEYKPDNVRFLSNVQGAYVGAVHGIFYREKPAANLMFGPFFAESLLISEVGRQAGAIQIGGTGRTIQVPFFIATCDYVLIGDELFVAGAYLGKKPEQVGAIYAQDLGKWLFIIACLLGSLFMTAGNTFIADLMRL